MTVIAVKYVESATVQINQYLASLFSESRQPAVLFESMNYSLLAPGKRLRPVFCLATANAFGVDMAAALPAAVALELVHAYSLIHDDLPILDNDDLRRGRATNHKIFGDAMALLAGDGLLTYAFEQISKPLQGVPAPRQLKMVQVLAHKSGCFGMVGGQVADVLGETTRGTLKELQFIHEHKTAALIEAAVHIGALFSDASNEQILSLCRYARKVGHAFQVIDDWLDVVGDETVLGKKTGMDVSLQKLTYPSLIGLDETKTLAETLVSEALEELDSLEIHKDVLIYLARQVVMRKH